jgi:hypothetical protein
VERPTLTGVGGSSVPVTSGPDTTKLVTDYFTQLEQKQQVLDSRLNGIEYKLGQLITLLQQSGKI